MPFITDTMLISDALGPCEVDTTSFAVFPHPPGVCVPIYYINQLDIGTPLVHVKKFYVLSKGPEPGIYSHWEDLESMGCVSGQGFRWKGFETPFGAISEWQKQCSNFHCHHIKALQPSPPMPRMTSSASAPVSPGIPRSPGQVASCGSPVASSGSAAAARLFYIAPLVKSPLPSTNWSLYSITVESTVTLSRSAAVAGRSVAPSGLAAVNSPSLSTDRSLYSVTVDAPVSPSTPARGSSKYFGLVSPSKKIIFSTPAEAKDALAAADAHCEAACLLFGENINDLACFFTDGGSLDD
ncbi:hypothetical protein C8J56DRAFT_1061483 [Mycena floridula]|nr:hypothetical protein C8J56DRAFT_1061483 [Mycena floridula]